MEMKVFAKEVCEAVKKGLGNGYCVEVHEIRKNNGIILHGLVPSREGHNVAPTIYLETLLEAYESGISFETAIRRLLDICREEIPEERIDVGFLRSFDKVKDRVCYRLICRKGNEELLKSIPHIKYLDLAVCFYYAYQRAPIGEGSILIHNFHMDLWQTSVSELYALAERNTPRIFPWECKGLGETLQEMEGSLEGTCDETSYCSPARILTNRRKIHGAACILYPGVLDRIAQEIGHDLFILPSSIHEVLILPDTGDYFADELREMVSEVNMRDVSPEEVLSGTIYRYSCSERKVTAI